MNEMVSNKDISFVIVASTIISLNFILTPLAYYSIFIYKDAVARTIIFSTDTCLDSAYLITIYMFLTESDFQSVITFGAFLYPCKLFCIYST